MEVMDAKREWMRRFIYFWRSVAPYLRYVFSGGLAAFIILTFSVGGYFYAELIEQLPENFPAVEIGTGLLWLAVYFNPIRTFAQEQDKAFLLPAEARLRPYFRRSLLVSLLLQCALAAFVWIIYWPLYRQAADLDSVDIIGLLGLLLLIKVVSLWSNWRETQFHDPRMRVFYQVVRAVITVLLLYVMLTYAWLPAAFFGLLLLITYIVAMRYPRKYVINWEEWIRKERLQHSRLYMFISWFVDVDELPRRMRERRYLNVCSRMIPFRAESTYTYLYFKTWLRSDVYPIMLRMVLIGAVIVFFLSADGWKIAAYAAGLAVLGVQFNAVRQFHRHAQWLHIYPLPDSQRARSVTRLNINLHLLFAGILALPLLLSADKLLWPTIAVLLMPLLIVGYHRRQNRKDQEQM